MSDVYRRILEKTRVDVPPDWLRIRTIDMHTAGEPLRVVVDGFPEIEGASVLDCRRYVRAHHDRLRTALMFEPRGHADMYGCLLLPPPTDASDFGVLFMHNEGYSTMCGHAVIALATLADEMGWIERAEPVGSLRIAAPCGPILARTVVENERIVAAEFECVPSFVVGLDREVTVPGLGTLPYDLAYGGAFYAYVDADRLGIPLAPESYRRLIETGMEIKRAVMRHDKEIRHPFEEELGFLYGTIFVGGPIGDGTDSRNVCIFAEGELDRSPTGSGVSGRMAIHRARGELATGETMRIESILGTVFAASIEREVEYGPYTAVVPRVRGTAHIVGSNEWLIDPADPLRDGFILR